MPTIMNMRLAGSTSPLRGRVEVLFNGTQAWTTICDDSFEVEDAAVVCRSMGLTGGAVLPGATFPPGTGAVLINRVACFGNESTLNACPSEFVGGGLGCNHAYEDSTVECGPGPGGERCRCLPLIAAGVMGTQGGGAN